MRDRMLDFLYFGTIGIDVILFSFSLSFILVHHYAPPVICLYLFIRLYPTPLYLQLIVLARSDMCTSPALVQGSM